MDTKMTPLGAYLLDRDGDANVPPPRTETTEMAHAIATTKMTPTLAYLLDKDGDRDTPPPPPRPASSLDHAA